VWSGGGGGANEMKGGLSYEVAVVLTDIVFTILCFTVLCFRVLSVDIFGYFCFPIIISGT